MKIIVINMPSAIKRRDRMENILASMNLDFHLLSAVDGKVDKENYRKRFLNNSKMILSDGEFGCLLSHIKAWEFIANSKEDENYLILEDDVNFSENFKNTFLHIKIPTDVIAIYRLETMLARVEISRKVQHKLEGLYNFYELHSNHAGSAAYAINKKTAIFLLHQAPKLTRAIDTELFDGNRRGISNFPVYQCIPAPCIQIMLLKNKSLSDELASQIAGREDSVFFLKRRRDKIIEPTKMLFRPIYLFVINLLLRKKGRVRVHVPFK